MRAFCQHLVASAAFQRSILTLILMAGLLVGLETHAGIVARFGDLLQVADRAVLLLFVLELIVRVGAWGA